MSANTFRTYLVNNTNIQLYIWLENYKYNCYAKLLFNGRNPVYSERLWASWSSSLYIFIRSYKMDFSYNHPSGLTWSGESIAILQWAIQKLNLCDDHI